MTIHKRRTLIVSYVLKNPFHHLQKPHKSFLYPLAFFSSARRINPENTIETSQYLLSRHQFSPESASKIASLVTHVRHPERADSVLDFLKGRGISQPLVENAVKSVPKLLSADLERTIKPKFKVLQDFGFSGDDIAYIISADPYILTRGVDKGLGPAISVLKNVLGSVEDVTKLLKITGQFLKFDLERTMLPNFEILKSCGVSESRLVKYIYNFPGLFLNKPESMRRFVERADELGVDRSSMMYFHAIRAIGSMSTETWAAKWELFRSLGLSDSEILQIFRKKPQVFAVSVRKMKAAIEFFLRNGRYGISHLAKHPEIFICSMDKRLRPRFRVLELLEEKNLLKKWPSLSSIYKSTDVRFFEMFVSPHLDEVGDVYMVK